MAFQQFNVYPTLTPVRLVSTANIAGTYYNGQTNNGVGATLTVAASSLTIDSVVCEEGDRVLLQTQTNTNEQGVYIVDSIGSTVVLKRASDQQSMEQMLAGQNVAVAAGSLNAGNFYTIVEPLPAQLGINALVFNADPGAGSVSFSGAASTANALPVLSDTAGNIKAAKTTVTLGQALSVTGAFTASGAIASTAGNVTSGSSADAGTFISFPATAASGTLIFAAVNNTGNTNVTVSNAAHGQASVYSIPDGGQATAEFIISDSAGTQHITSGSLQVDAGNLLAGVSGAAGFVSSFPATLARGSLRLTAVNNTGDTLTTISNAAMGQASVVSIPDPGQATSNFLLTDSAGTQSIATGNLTLTLGDLAASAGDITAGSSGNAGFVSSFPTTASKGSLQLAAVDNTGNTITTISNAAMGQASVVSIPDPAAATANFCIRTTALVSGNVVKASGTAGLLVDAGFAVLANTTAAYGGGGTSNAFVATGIGATSIVTASILAQSNTASIVKVVPTANTLTVTFSADPGAATQVSWIAITPAV